MRKRAAKYRRISSDREGRELGVDRQDEQLTALAERIGVDVVADYVDNDIGASTRSRKPRPDYKRMLDDARAGRFDVILAATAGRLTRRPREHEDLIDLSVQHGTVIHYASSPSFDLNTAQGRRVARTLAAQDAGESEDIAERVSAAARQRAERGLNHGGHRCFGYDTSGMNIEPGEAAEIAWMAEQMLAGVPLGAITRDLNARGVCTAHGKPWQSTAVRQLLVRPRLAGLAEHRGVIVGRGQWPPILTEAQHQALVALINDPTRRTSTGNRAAYLLSGIATCGVCGANITSGGVKRSGKPGAPGWRRIYACRTGKHVGRRQDWIDDYVAMVVVRRLSQPDAADLLVDKHLPDFDALRKEEGALRVRLDEAAADFADGLLDRQQLRTVTGKVRERLEEIRRVQQHTGRGLAIAGLVGADDVQATWDGYDLDRRRAVVASLLEVRLLPGSAGPRRFDVSKVEIAWKE